MARSISRRGIATFWSPTIFVFRMDVDVLAVYPHAHYLGHVLEGYATLPNGQRKWLIRIPDWDPNWQGAYHYRQSIFLPKGTVISMRYHYDNSSANPRNPNQPPRRVVARQSGHRRDGAPLASGLTQARRASPQEATGAWNFRKP